MRLRTVSLAAAAAIVALSTGAQAQGPTPAPGKPMYGTFGFDTAGMNATVKPGDDFYGYANGAWDKRTVIPEDRSSFSTFGVLNDRALQRTRALIEEAAAQNAAMGSETRKIGDFYAAYMDEAAIERAGLKPIKAELASIAAINSNAKLSSYLGSSLRADVDALNMTELHTDRLFGLWVVEDLNDTSHYLPYLMQGGTWLPSREYYLTDSPRFVEIRKAYAAHVERLFALAGFSDAAARAQRVLALETEIARAQWNASDSTDAAKTNVQWARDAFATEAPGIDWTAFFKAAGLAGQPRFGAWQASAIKGISAQATATPLDAWRDYLAFHAIARRARALPKAFADESFAFNGTVLAGTTVQTPRWRRAVEATNDGMGQAVGKLYVERYFSAQAKSEVQAMVTNVLAAFDARIDRLDWMTPQTKAKAKEKLANFHVGVGYPDKWRDYSALEVMPGDAVGNIARAEMFEYRRNIAKLSQAVDRGEWHLDPQIVNALNMPMQNAISFPAAILEPSFFDPHADAAVNYGAIGSVIGHEISHGFDDTGALFDARGQIANWWTPEDMAHFKAAGAALAAQFDTYKPLPDLSVNGELTLGENIADLAGLAVAYDAYQRSLGGKPAPVIDGFTGDQRFFLGYAQENRSKYREALMRRVLVGDGHAPSEYRALTVRNLDAWYAAFGVKPTETLALPPEKRVTVW
jgi:putative endopeptidase